MNKRNGWTTFWKQKQYLIAGALIIVAAACMTALYSKEEEQKRMEQEQKFAEEFRAGEEVAMEGTEEMQEASSVLKPRETTNTETAEIEKPDHSEIAENEEKDTAEEIAENHGEDTAEEIAQKSEEKDTEAETVANTKDNLHFMAENGLIWPMEGNVVIDYSMDSTVYFPTLDQYRYNPAVIIAGEVNSKVYSVAKGKVESIENNEVTGCTVTISLGDGYEAVYGQLKELNFDVGDYVEAGHVIGYIGEPTKYFSSEGSNLYFELKKDGEPVDPIVFFE